MPGQTKRYAMGFDNFTYLLSPLSFALLEIENSYFSGQIALKTDKFQWRTDFIAVANLDDVATLQKMFIDHVAQTFVAARPFMRFLCDAMRIPL